MWTSMSGTFPSAYFLLQLFQSEGWWGEGWDEWQFTNSHHCHGISHRDCGKLQSGVGGWGAQNRWGGTRSGCGCLARVAETQFLSSLGLPKWPTQGRDPVTACLSRESLTVGSFPMRRPREGREQWKEHTLQQQTEFCSWLCHVLGVWDPGPLLNLSHRLLMDRRSTGASAWKDGVPLYVWIMCKST